MGRYNYINHFRYGDYMNSSIQVLADNRKLADHNQKLIDELHTIRTNLEVAEQQNEYLVELHNGDQKQLDGVIKREVKLIKLLDKANHRLLLDECYQGSMLHQQITKQIEGKLDD